MTYYDETARNYNELHGEEQKRKARLILDNLEIRPEDTLLDVGCGTGIATAFFPCKLTGIDPAEELLKQASFPTKVASAENIPFPDESFDIVISLTAVHNFTDIKKGLQEINRVAKRDIVLSVLKKSERFNEIERLIKDIFRVKKEVDDLHDIIFFCSKL